MGDEDPGTGAPGAGAGGGTPPAGGAPPPPAPTGTPPAGGAPPPPPAARAGGQPNGRNRNKHAKRGGKNGQQPFDQHPAFRKRVDQEAARVIRKKLGCTLEEALALVERGRAAPGGGAPAPGGQPTAAAPGAGPTAAERRLQDELEDAQRRIKKQSRKIKRI